MPTTDLLFIAELRNKVEQLIQSGLNRKEAIIACDSECNYNEQPSYTYMYKQFQIEICFRNAFLDSEMNLGNACWDSNIHFSNQTVVTIGSYRTRLEAALMAEKTINKW